jgi:hypothetical protein
VCIRKKKAEDNVESTKDGPSLVFHTLGLGSESPFVEFDPQDPTNRIQPGESQSRAYNVQCSLYLVEAYSAAIGTIAN